MENQIKETENTNGVSSSDILVLIEKYEDKIKAIKMLQSRPYERGTDPIHIRLSEERLNARLYERKTFVDDLKSLLTKK